MANTFRPRALRNEANIADAEVTFGAAANNTTKVGHSTLSADTKMWIPNSTNNTTTSVPSVGASPAGNGWRTRADEPLASTTSSTTRDERISIPAGTWPLRLRYRRIDGTLPADVANVTVTAILYRMNSANSFQEEIARRTSGNLTFTATVQTLTLDLTTAGTITAQQGDKFQLELYVTYPSAVDVSGQNLAITLDEADGANGGPRFTTPDFTVIAQEGLSTRAAGLVSIRRRIATVKSAAAAGRATLSRKTRPLPRQAAARGIATLIRKTRKPLATVARAVATLSRALTLHRVMTAAASGKGTIIRTIRTTKVVQAVGAAALVRKTRKSLVSSTAGVATLVRKTGKIVQARAKGVTLLNTRIFKVLTAAARGITTLGLKLRFARTLAAAARGSARGFVKLAMEKVPGGGATQVVKKLFWWTED